jgi:uncharacterized membrane protein
MELHPIFVHFPVALLTIYAVLELIRFKKITSKPYWFHVKAFFVIFGAMGAIAAFMTGPDEAKMIRIGQLHAEFATGTLIVFLIIGLAYAFEWFRPSKYSLFIMRPYIIIPLAFIGLVLVTITGGLGGAMVHGTHADPFMAPILKLLGVY